MRSRDPIIIEKTIDLLREGQLTPALRLVRLAQPDAGVFPAGRALVARIDRRPSTRRGLVHALFDPCEAVRSMAQQLVPQLSPDASDEVALLLLEALQPFRPLPGRTDHRERYASPLAEPLLALGVARSVRPNDAAASYFRSSIDGAVECLALLSGRRYLQLREVVEAKSRSPLDAEGITPLGWTLGLDPLGVMARSLRRFGATALMHRRSGVAQALELWVAGRTLLSTDPSATAFQQWEWLFLDGQDRRVQRRRLRALGVRMAVLVPTAQRERVFRLAMLVLGQMSEGDPDRESLGDALQAVVPQGEDAYDIA